MPIVIKLRKSEFFGYKINEDNILLLVNVYHDHCNLKVIQIGRKIRKLHFSVRSSHRQIWNYFVNFSDFHCVSRAIRRSCVCVCVCVSSAVAAIKSIDTYYNTSASWGWTCGADVGGGGGGDGDGGGGGGGCGGSAPDPLT